MPRNHYVYTFVKSGEQPDSGKHNGMVRRTAFMNAKMIASRDSHSQDVYRKPARSKNPWQFFQTVKVPFVPKAERSVSTPSVETSPSNETAPEDQIVLECVRVIEAVMPADSIAKTIRPLHFRREGMREAVDAIRRHFGIEA